MHRGKQRPRDRVATRDVVQVVCERRAVEVEVRVGVITELEPGACPLAKQLDLGCIVPAAATELSFVDEANRRHAMRSQRTNQQTSEAVVVRRRLKIARYG